MCTLAQSSQILDVISEHWMCSLAPFVRGQPFHFLSFLSPRVVVLLDPVFLIFSPVYCNEIPSDFFLSLPENGLSGFTNGGHGQ